MIELGPTVYLKARDMSSGSFVQLDVSGGKGLTIQYGYYKSRDHTPGFYSSIRAHLWHRTPVIVHDQPDSPTHGHHSPPAHGSTVSTGERQRIAHPPDRPFAKAVLNPAHVHLPVHSGHRLRQRRDPATLCQPGLRGQAALPGANPLRRILD